MMQTPSGKVQYFTFLGSCGAGRLVLVDGSSAEFDECLWCTQASPAAWVARTGLPTGLQQHSLHHLPLLPAIFCRPYLPEEVVMPISNVEVRNEPDFVHGV